MNTDAEAGDHNTQPTVIREVETTRTTMNQLNVDAISAKLGVYELIETLGSGGMGVVYLARDPRTRKLVAIKTIKPELSKSDQAIHRFIAEARHMQRMKHPCVLEVLEVAENKGESYYVMRYIGSGSLARMMRPGEPFPIDQLFNISLQIADALRYAHDEAGLIHRDIKPENILVDSTGRAYLSDFGLVRTVFNDSVGVGPGSSWTVGTRPYMAPEIVEGKAGDTRADIYSFGAMLYELASGHAPYENVLPQRMLDAIRKGPPAEIAQLVPQLPAGLVTVIQSAMGRDLRDRYAHMADLLSDLGRARQGKQPAGARGRVARGLYTGRSARSAAAALFGFATVALAVLAMRACTPANTARAVTGATVSAAEPTAQVASYQQSVSTARIAPVGIMMDHLKHAISTNDLQELKSLIESENIDPNVQLPNGCTALEEAMQTHRDDLANYLVHSSAVNLNAMLDRVNTGYAHVAARCGNVNVLKVLSKAGVDLNRADSSGKTVADYVKEFDGPVAVQQKMLEILKSNQ